MFVKKFGSGITAVVFTTTDEGAIPETSRLKLNWTLFNKCRLRYTSQSRPLYIGFICKRHFDCSVCRPEENLSRRMIELLANLLAPPTRHPPHHFHKSIYRFLSISDKIN